MYNRIVNAIANVMYASVGTVVFTSKKVSEGYDVVVDEGKLFTRDVKASYVAKKNKKMDEEFLQEMQRKGYEVA